MRLRPFFCNLKISLNYSLRIENFILVMNEEASCSNGFSEVISSIWDSLSFGSIFADDDSSKRKLNSRGNHSSFDNLGASSSNLPK